MWSVAPLSLDEARVTIESDQISLISDLDAAMKGLEVIHVLPHTLEYPPLPPLQTTSEDRYLLEALHRARLVKDEEEIELIREANRISSGAHEVLMRELGRYAQKRRVKERNGKAGIIDWEVESETDAEALFVATCKRAGCVIGFLS
jgi:Xaa-Pro dipeptidase